MVIKRTYSKIIMKVGPNPEQIDRFVLSVRCPRWGSLPKGWFVFQIVIIIIVVVVGRRIDALLVVKIIRSPFLRKQR